MSGKKKYYTVMFVPEDNARTFSIRIHRNIIRTFLLFLFLICSGLIILIVFSGQISLKLQMVDALREENKRLQAENSALAASFKKMKKVDELSQYLSNLAHAVGETPPQPQLATKIPVSDRQPAQNESEPVDTQIHPDQIPASIPLISAPLGGFWSSVPNIRPVDGWITKRFAQNEAEKTGFHKGLDFAATEGTPVRATAPGIVANVENEKYFGLMVTIEHKFGFITRYGHCSQVLVSKGSKVERGQTIALVGNTGYSSAPHLHYEIIKDGEQVDPSKYMFFNVYE
ncbi:MAG: peptidoglycan DD-metalloendopeptidase family protein [Chitinivibrionales bacterium]|nr:peptidoglycan DD-metalloendopeptidase family protein [Chitinivibrionales bacterium]